MAWKHEDAKTVREMIIHESNLMNHRLGWMMQLNGFLFASLAFASQNVHVLMPILAALGFTTSLSVMYSLHKAHDACNRLANDWRNNKPTDFDGPNVIGRQTIGIKSLLLPWFSLPLLLATAWIAVLVLYHRH
jgi:hypothetical protein